MSIVDPAASRWLPSEGSGYAPPELLPNGVAGECAWWVESRQARCKKATVPNIRVCQYHERVYLRRVEKHRAEHAARAERNRPRDEARAAKRAERRAQIDAELERLVGPIGGDRAAVNTPLRGRIPSDTKIARVAALYAERDRL